MSLFGPTIIGGGSGGGQSSGSAPAPSQGAAASGVRDLRVSPDGSTVQAQAADGSWHDTSLTPAALLAALPMIELTDSDGVVHATLPGTI